MEELEMRFLEKSIVSHLFRAQWAFANLMQLEKGSWIIIQIIRGSREKSPIPEKWNEVAPAWCVCVCVYQPVVLDKSLSSTEEILVITETFSQHTGIWRNNNK